MTALPMHTAHDFARAAAATRWFNVAFSPEFINSRIDETTIHHHCVRLSARRAGCTYRFEITEGHFPLYAEAGRIIATQRRGGAVVSHRALRYTRVTP